MQLSFPCYMSSGWKTFCLLNFYESGCYQRQWTGQGWGGERTWSNRIWRLRDCRVGPRTVKALAFPKTCDCHVCLILISAFFGSSTLWKYWLRTNVIVWPPPHPPLIKFCPCHLRRAQRVRLNTGWQNNLLGIELLSIRAVQTKINGRDKLPRQHLSC